MGLNPQQQQAVDSIQGPLLILAGAGSGKTTVLMHRIAHMIQSGIPPWQILAVTFTNKAANEMRERMTNHVSPEQAARIQMSTFHSFCLQVLKREWQQLGIFTHAFDIADPNHATSYMRGIIKDKTKTKPATMMKYISSLKNEMVDAQTFCTQQSTNPHIDWEKVNELIQAIPPEHLKVLEWAYPAYEELMLEKNLLDFDDLILYTIQLFLSAPAILENYQDHYPYIMVDEYQDTNRSQYILMQLLAKKYRNLAVVGDDFQSIYAFRGSDIRNILQFDKDYPDATVIKLEENYRSTQTIIEAANGIIAHNKNQKNKTLFTTNVKGNPLMLFRGEYAQDSAEWIAQTIAETVAAGTKTYQDFAILYRANSQSADAEIALKEAGIPFVKLSGRGFFEAEELQDILKYLAFIHNPNNLDAFSRIIRKPKRRIAEKTIKKIEDSFYDQNLLQIIEDLSSIERVQKKAVEEGKTFASMIQRYQAIKDTTSVATIIQGVLQDIDYEGKVLVTYEPEVRETKRQNIDKMIELIITKEQQTGTPVLLADYMEELLLFDTSEADDPQNRVQLMTIHGSKGLEFPVVFVLGMNKNIFPSLRLYGQPDYTHMSSAALRAQLEKSQMELEEERRLCYVAFTRAKEQLYLTCATHRILKKDGSRQSLDPSPFLDEFNPRLCRIIE